MTEFDPIQHYLEEFSRQLPPHGRHANRVLREIEDHLCQTADQLRHQGIEPAEAARLAVQRFGAPRDVFAQFELEAPIESEVMVMVRYLLINVACVTLLFAAAFLILGWFDDAPTTVFVAKVVVSTLILGCSFVLLYRLRTTKPMQLRERGIVMGCGLISIVLGVAGAVWTAHLGLTTGDWEYYGFGGAGLLVLQGALAAMGVVVGESNASKLAA
jgi:hypothetical protein